MNTVFWYFRRHFVTLVFATLLPSLVHAQSKTTELFRKYKSSVLVVLAFDKSGMPNSVGSGFYFEDDLIATNAHVVKDASRVLLRTIGSDSPFEALEIAHISYGLDLALLRVSRRGVPIPVSSAAGLEVGEKVVAIGNPRGLEGTVSEGIVSAIRNVEEFKMLQITAPISPGSSGGPVFSDIGTVIGVATSTLRDSQNINFAVPASYLRTLKGTGKNWEPLTANTKSPESSRSVVSITQAKQSQLCSSFVPVTITNNSASAVSSIRFLAILKSRSTGAPIDYVHQQITEFPYLSQEKLMLKSKAQIVPARLAVPKTLKFEADMCPEIHLVEFRVLDFEVLNETGLEKDFLPK